jgi:hypothetical protein
LLLGCCVSSSGKRKTRESPLPPNEKEISHGDYEEMAVLVTPSAAVLISFATAFGCDT